MYMISPYFLATECNDSLSGCLLQLPPPGGRWVPTFWAGREVINGYDPKKEAK